MRDGQIVSDERAAQDARRSRDARPSTRPRRGRFVRGAAARRRPPARFWAFGLMILAAAAQAIARNKMRSALTMLGVFIGVAALIAMVAVGQGANEAVRKQIESLGTNRGRDPARRGHDGRRARRLRQRLDADGERCAGDPARRSAVAQRRLSHPPDRAGAVSATRTGRRISRASAPNYPPITNWQIAAGRGITPDDESKAASSS